jgi:ABC-type transporter Mla subunit MlaD
MQKYNLLNISVGIIFILVIFIIFNLNFSNTSSYNAYKIYISNVEGIKNNTSINIGGRKIGYVSSLNLDENNNSYINAFVFKNIQIPTDSSFFVSVPSLFASNRSINIILGINEEYLANNDVVYNSNLGLDLNGMLDLIDIYLKSLTK